MLVATTIVKTRAEIRTGRNPCRQEIRTGKSAETFPIRALLFLFACTPVLAGTATAQQPVQAVVAGEQMLYHPISITFEGPESSETGTPNPFRDYRLNVTFRHEETGDRLVAPGYFAADGNAADTGADSGNRWRVHVTPHRTGTWSWEASFRTGTDVAIRINLV